MMWIVYIRIQESGRIEGDHEYVGNAGHRRAALASGRCELSGFEGGLHPRSDVGGPELS